MIGGRVLSFYRPCFQKLQCLHSSTRCTVRNSAVSSDSVYISEDVAHALNSGSPVVALETTIITHGMPYPDNLRMATEVESLISAKGVTPASIGILQGNLHIGMNKSQLGYLADPGTKSVKTSRRDFPYVMSQKLNGGTTVSGTMLAANIAGIPVFVTGGIGGVHRGAEHSMDISADLTELGRTPVAVVSAGIKSILDIGRTLEYLETEGVCIASYGESSEFPAFFTRHSGYKAPYHVEDHNQAARLIDSSLRLGLQSGILIAVPIPTEFEAQGDIIETAVHRAVQESIQTGLVGKEVTPFILQRVNELTQGKSLQSNIHLVKNNAKVGSDIAIELSRLQQDSREGKTDIRRVCGSNGRPLVSTRHTKKSATSDVVVIGGSIVDFYARLKPTELQLNGGTYPGRVQELFGGVGRNVADCLSRIGVNPLFISAIGNDSHKAPFQVHCKHMDLSGVAVLDNVSTATYFAILQHTGALVFGVGDMEIHNMITPEYISSFEKDIVSASLVCMDGNISVEAIEYICQLCQNHHIPVWFEPTDLNKATKPFQTSVTQPVTYTSPNLNELRAIASYLSGTAQINSGNADDLREDSVLDESIQLLNIVGEHTPVVIVTLGKHGVILCRHGDRINKLPIKGQYLQMDGPLVMEYYPASVPGQAPASVVSVSGAGDCMTAAIISGILQGHDPAMCMRMGLMSASVSLQSCHTVPPDFQASFLSPEVIREKMNIRPQLLLHK